VPVPVKQRRYDNLPVFSYGKAFSLISVDFLEMSM